MFFEEKVKEINNILRKLESGKTAVWCLGMHTEKLAKYTNLLKYGVSFFIDKNANLYMNREIYGIAVLSPRRLILAV